MSLSDEKRRRIEAEMKGFRLGPRAPSAKPSNPPDMKSPPVQALLYCWQCGASLPTSSAVCLKCGVATGPTSTSRATIDPVIKFLIPVGRSSFSIAAGYAGLFALFSPLALHIGGQNLAMAIFFGLPAPLAMALGIFAVVDISRHPNLGGRGRATFAIIVGVLSSVLLLIGGTGLF